MRLIDVSIPHFDDDSALPVRPTLAKQKPTIPAFKLSGGIFGMGDQYYHLDDDLEVSDKEDDKAEPTLELDADDEFFEARDGPTEVRFVIPPGE